MSSLRSLKMLYTCYRKRLCKLEQVRGGPRVPQQSLSLEKCFKHLTLFSEREKKSFPRIDMTMLWCVVDGELRLIWSIFGMVSMAGDQACLTICWNSCQHCVVAVHCCGVYSQKRNISPRRVTDFYK